MVLSTSTVDSLTRSVIVTQEPAIRSILTYVSRSVERAAISAARAFVRGFCDLDKMGLCPTFQDGFELGRCGVLMHGYIMHLDCQVSYEAYERGRQAHQSAPFAALGFGCLYAIVCDPVMPLWAKIIWCRVV